MKYRVLGRTNFKVSEIGMGTEHLLDKDEEDVIQTIKAVVDGGVNYFDCHPGDDYDHNSHVYEGYKKLGKAISFVNNRSELRLTYLATASLPPSDARLKFENFLRDMNTSYAKFCCINKNGMEHTIKNAR